MGTVDGPMTTSAASRWLSRPRGFIIALAVASAGLIALGQHWLAIADLVPLLLVLPCAAMMFKCKKGVSRGPQSGTSAQSDTPTAIDTPTPYKLEPVYWSG
jgi:hypothetical protein